PAGAAVGEPLTGHHGPVNAVAAGALPDGTPVIISGGPGSGGPGDGTVRVWRTADGAPGGEPLTGHHGPVDAVAAGAVPDGTPVIISGGGEGTVRGGGEGRGGRGAGARGRARPRGGAGGG